MPSILLIPNRLKDKDYHVTISFIEAVQKKQEVLLFTTSENYEELKQLGIERYNNQKIDFVIVFGGDGTLLRAAHHYNQKNRLFVGINLGTIGYLNGSKSFSLDEVVDSIFNHNYQVITQPLLDCKLFHQQNTSSYLVYNEASIHRGCTMKQLHLRSVTENGGEEQIDADGVIIATSMGSSAYNLSAGGKKLEIGTKRYVITPICPKAHQEKSTIVAMPDWSEFILLSSRSEEDRIGQYPVLSIDGLLQVDLDKGDRIKIDASNETFSMVRLGKK